MKFILSVPVCFLFVLFFDARPPTVVPLAAMSVMILKVKVIVVAQAKPAAIVATGMMI
jgi:hypothetical protein